MSRQLPVGPARRIAQTPRRPIGHTACGSLSIAHQRCWVLYLAVFAWHTCRPLPAQSSDAAAMSFSLLVRHKSAQAYGCVFHMQVLRSSTPPEARRITSVVPRKPVERYSPRGAASLRRLRIAWPCWCSLQRLRPLERPCSSRARALARVWTQPLKRR